MESNDWSESFDFWWVYTEIQTNKLIKSRLWDGRFLEVIFEDLWDNKTRITEIWDAENINSIELQNAWWQWILVNLKNYIENL
jgi:hypothetical protein